MKDFGRDSDIGKVTEQEDNLEKLTLAVVDALESAS